MAIRKLRSSTVVLGGMGMLAAVITSCGSEPDKRCVDPLTYKQLPSYKCKSGGGGGDSSSGSGGGSYYYGGKSKNGRVEGGSFDKAAVERGGFGCSGTGGG
ncbi:hypothetical protein [Streptomyces sp. NPDC047985]|uniref:hypothetical protein n=1 Tax=unclassified Streptomyces TaxID=2593676 RepID=UPI003437DDE5